LVKQWQSEPNSGFQLPSCTLHYFDPVGLLLGSMLQDPDIMYHLVYSPQEKLTTCGIHINDEATSAERFYSAFNDSPASENGKLKKATYLWASYFLVMMDPQLTKCKNILIIHCQ
jgi:hypothetical protein